MSVPSELVRVVEMGLLLIITATDGLQKANVVARIGPYPVMNIPSVSCECRQLPCDLSRIVELFMPLFGGCIESDVNHS